MTTYIYKLTLNDTESIMMNAALELMIKHCEERLNEPESAYSAWLASAKAVKSRMSLNTEQMSGNNFWDNQVQ